MDLAELKKRMFLKEYLEERERQMQEQKSASSKHPCEGMSIQEIFSFVTFLQQRLEEESARNEDIQKRLDAIMEQLNASQKTNESNAKALARMIDAVDALKEEKDALAKELEKQKSQNAINKKFRFGSKSQKGTSRKTTEKGRDEEKEEHDGTNGTIINEPTDTEASMPQSKPESAQKQERPYRKGMKYNTMMAGKTINHPSDRKKLPAGAVVIGSETRKVFKRVCFMEEHDYEFVTYLMPDGSLHTDYFPCESDGQVDHTLLKPLPGTHATPELVAHLAFDKYNMMTPLYRELSRFSNESMRLCRQTLTNWLQKGAEQLKNLLPALKNQALAPGSVVNVDETWCRLHLAGKSGKKYIWCLVNKMAKVVFFFYDNGSRGRHVLKDFLGDADIAALQSDGYNIYNYLDDSLVKIEHICCLAHARAKLKYALEQGNDERAAILLHLIAELYRLEDEYKKNHLSFEEIKQRRNDEVTLDIITNLSTQLHQLLNDGSPKGDLIQKALNYLSSYWKQIFNYRHDGRYSIDNSIAEQCIRPLTRERANSLHYASDKGAETSAIYHTIFSTCKMVGVSALEYLKKFFNEILTGRKDWDNLLPSTIALVR